MNAWLRFNYIGLALGVVIVLYGVRQNQGTAEEAVIKAHPVAAHFEFQGYHAAPLGLGKFLLYRWQAPTTSFPAYGLRSDFVTYTICPWRRREINFMQNNLVGQPKRVNIFAFLNILWGYAMLPLWTLGVYYSFKEGPIEIQGLVMSSAALVVSLCLIVSPLFRRNAAITALMFSFIFTAANFVYNTGSINQMISGLILGVLCLVVPSIFL